MQPFLQVLGEPPPSIHQFSHSSQTLRCTVVQIHYREMNTLLYEEGRGVEQGTQAAFILQAIKHNQQEFSYAI